MGYGEQLDSGVFEVDEMDRPHEACGVFAVYAPGEPVAEMAQLALHTLQHRGQEAAGIAVTDDYGEITVVKGEGLVAEVLTKKAIGGLEGPIANAHVRYGTSEHLDGFHAAHPMYYNRGGTHFTIAVNGTLTNTEELKRRYKIGPGLAGTDAEVLKDVIGSTLGEGGDLGACLRHVLPEVDGAFSLTVTTADGVYGARDPYGMRPLVMGSLKEGMIVTSETPALDIVGAKFVREIEPGEIVRIDKDGVHSEHFVEEAEVDEQLCAFEFIYFSRQDGELMGQRVFAARYRMGQRLAQIAPLPEDTSGEDREVMVMPVPASGTPAAQGFAAESGLTYGDGLNRNNYVGRSFIEPSQSLRDLGVLKKLSPLREQIEGKRLVVVDDSIVRGTTHRQVVRMLRDAGAAEVHLRITAAPYQYPCFFGMDTPDKGNLIAAQMSVEEIAEHLGVDSLAFLTPEDIRWAVGSAAGRLCMACMTGDYPAPRVPVPSVAFLEYPRLR